MKRCGRRVSNGCNIAFMSAFRVSIRGRPILPPDQQPAAFIAFDLLRDGDDDLRNLPLTERRKRLEALFKTSPAAGVGARPTDGAIDRRRHRAPETGERGELGGPDGQARPVAVSHREAQSRVAQAQAEQAGRVCGGAVDRSGRHTRAFRIADPRRSRQRLAQYAGEVGTGFKAAELDRVMQMLRRLETPTCPSIRSRRSCRRRARPIGCGRSSSLKSATREITDDGRLRHPAYLGLRDDKTAGGSHGAKVPKVPVVPRAA